MSIRTLSDAHLLCETYADNDFTIEELESVTYYEDGLAIIRISGNPIGITVANHDGNLHALLGERVVVVWRNALPEPEPDPLDESNKADRIDRDGDRWAWCDTCGGFRVVECHDEYCPGVGLSAAELDEAYGPLTFAPR